MKSLYGSISINSSNELVSDLLSSSGMFGMLNTIWLVISAMIFGGVMERAGFLKQITTIILNKIKSTGSLISSTAGTCIFFNLTASDQYLSIVVPGKMYSSIYRDKGLAPENLSRTLEDGGTVTSVLVPWNTCGAYHASVLNVATLSYLPFCFFSLISPLMTILFAYLRIKIKKIS
jgi:NhaC family Na+:H+ antiporter